jgi:hypothetical protein
MTKAMPIAVRKNQIARKLSDSTSGPVLESAIAEELMESPPRMWTDIPTTDLSSDDWVRSQKNTEISEPCGSGAANSEHFAQG